MCSTGPFQYRWWKGYIYSSCYCHHQIWSIHLSHCYHIVPWLCAWDFVTSYSVTYCIYVPGKPGICFHYYCAVYDECKYPDTFWLADRTRLFVQYTISLSSLCKLIWRHWTYKMPVRYILSSVWVRLSIFSPLYIIPYVRLYGFSLPISLVMIERIYILCLIIIIKSELWTITHCLGLGHETMVSAVCLSIFLEHCGIGKKCILGFVILNGALWDMEQVHSGICEIGLCYWETNQPLTQKAMEHYLFNTLRPRQNCRHTADDIFKCIFLMIMYAFRLRFHWNLFLSFELTISQHWFR